MQKFEQDYAKLVIETLVHGRKRKTRNATTTSVFGKMLKIDVRNHFFPILQGRTMYPKGVFGELAAMLRQPKHIDDFTKWGCNYWGLWAKPDGSINVDYGNTWFNFNGVDQVAQLKDKLANNPTDRRMIITSWKPDGMDNLSLPCCHHTYQFYVENGELHMSWSQRSVDLMIGLPSDIVFAAAWLIAIAREFGLKPGEITMFLGDCHVYEQHLKGAREYLDNVNSIELSEDYLKPPTYIYTRATGLDFCSFEPSDIQLAPYHSLGKIDLELIA